MPTDAEKPDWWIENEEDRMMMQLPEYEPPRFDDDVYVHEVVPALEEREDCEIQFIGFNVEWGDDWDVVVDGDEAFTVSRARTDSGNTIYKMASAEFESKVEAATA